MIQFRYILLTLLVGTTTACGSDDQNGAASSGGSAGTSSSHGGASTGGVSSGGNAAGGTTSSGGVSTASGGSTNSDSSVTVEIKAAEGGEVVLGDASLSIPKGALSADTEITLRAASPEATLPELASVEGLVYDFGPDGTTFEQPVDLSLPLSVAPGADEVAVISWLDTETNTWKDLEATVEKGIVTAQIQHFTLFVVRLKNSPQTIDCSFQACGGNVSGTWDLVSGCVDAAVDALAQCPDGTVDMNADISGVMMFASGGYHVQFDATGTIAAEIPAACVTSAGCNPFSQDLEGTCTETSTHGCSCTAPMTPHSTDETGSYTLNSKTITLIADGDSSGDTVEYCVSGSTLKIKTINGDGSTTLFVATKH